MARSVVSRWVRTPGSVWPQSFGVRPANRARTSLLETGAGAETEAEAGAEAGAGTEAGTGTGAEAEAGVGAGGGLLRHAQRSAAVSQRTPRRGCTHALCAFVKIDAKLFWHAVLSGNVRPRAFPRSTRFCALVGALRDDQLGVCAAVVGRGHGVALRGVFAAASTGFDEHGTGSVRVCSRAPCSAG